MAMKVESNDILLDGTITNVITSSSLEVSNNDISIREAGESIHARYGTFDYEELDNKPKLDGREIKGDISELDPTVPQWAKQPSKPAYSYEEIEDKPDEYSNDYIQKIWDDIFNGSEV